MAETITIYKRQYALPVLATERFAQVQRRIRERQQMIQEGKRARPIENVFAFVSRGTLPVNFMGFSCGAASCL